jgi:menaquinone-dependent protoporphyrinogen oxidase
MVMKWIEWIKVQTAKRILIAYASRCGPTGDIAETIGQTLCRSQAATEVRLIENVDDPGPYDAVILGSAIRAGTWLHVATGFVKNHQDTLRRMPVAYFVACTAMRDNTPEIRRKALAYLDPLFQSVPEVKPIDTGLFAGAVDYKKLSFFQRTVLKAKEIPEGDFCNFKEIRAWALKLHPAISDAP